MKNDILIHLNFEDVNRFLFKRNEIAEANLLNNYKHRITNEGLFVEEKVYESIVEKLFDSISVGDFIFIPKEIDVWETNGKRFKVKNKCRNKVLELTELFSSNNMIWVGYVDLDDRVKKLERILK